MKQKRKLIFILGPTASGKSNLAIEWAKKYQGVIFNCDSIQVFQELNIGSAKPNNDELKIVPHFLYDFLPPGSVLTAGEYLRYFSQALVTIDQNTPVFVVGGTGFYFQALEHGMYDVQPTPPDLKKKVLEEINTEGGAGRLYQELQAFDPEYAAKINHQDHYRIARAIEIIRHEGKKVSEVMSASKKDLMDFDFEILKIGVRPTKEKLRENIRLRMIKMLDQGLIQETKTLVDAGFSNWSPLKSVGYKEVQIYLNENKSLDWLKEWIEIGTWQLAKKQMTWFKRDQKIHWLNPMDRAEVEVSEKLLMEFI